MENLDNNANCGLVWGEDICSMVGVCTDLGT